MREKREGKERGKRVRGKGERGGREKVNVT